MKLSDFFLSIAHGFNLRKRERHLMFPIQPVQSDEDALRDDWEKVGKEMKQLLGNSK